VPLVQSSNYRALVEQADRPLRRAGHSEWLERLQAEARET
jgi:hypothetical protein